MAMAGGLDLHRRQITFDTLEVESGEEWRVGSGSRIGLGSVGGCARTSLVEPTAR
jgi:hypothetical protein